MNQLTPAAETELNLMFKNFLNRGHQTIYELMKSVLLNENLRKAQGLFTMDEVVQAIEEAIETGDWSKWLLPSPPKTDDV